MNKCRHCGAEKNGNDICPNCGSRDIIITDDFFMFDGRKVKKKDDTLYKSSSGKHNIYCENSLVLDFNRDRQKEVIRETTVDRLNDVYAEKVATLDGEVIIDKNEKLSEHINHGSARKENENGQA